MTTEFHIAIAKLHLDYAQRCMNSPSTIDASTEGDLARIRDTAEVMLRSNEARQEKSKP